MNNKNIIKYGLDLFLSLGFVLMFDKMALGMKLHEIIGLVIGGAVLIHLVLNYKWIIGVSKKLFSKNLSTRLRLCYILNLMLFICVTLIILSGIFISKVLFTSITSQNHIWKSIHMGVSNIALGLIGIHIGLHWNWVINVSKRIFKFNLQEKFSKAISNFLIIVILIFGCYNIYSQGFIQKSVMLFTTSQNANIGHGGVMKKTEGRPNFDKDNLTEEELNQLKESNPDKKMSPNFNKEDMKSKMPSGNSINIKSIAMLIINYLSICGVFTIVTYYIDKAISKKKSLSK